MCFGWNMFDRVVWISVGLFFVNGCNVLCDFFVGLFGEVGVLVLVEN